MKSHSMCTSNKALYVEVFYAGLFSQSITSFTWFTLFVHLCVTFVYMMFGMAHEVPMNPLHRASWRLHWHPRAMLPLRGLPTGAGSRDDECLWASAVPLNLLSAKNSRSLTVVTIATRDSIDQSFFMLFLSFIHLFRPKKIHKCRMNSITYH